MKTTKRKITHFRRKRTKNRDRCFSIISNQTKRSHWMWHSVRFIRSKAFAHTKKGWK